MVDLWGWGRGRGNGKGFLTPSLRKAVFVRQGRGILYQIFSYSGGTDTRNYGATRQAASDDQGMRLLQQMFKEPSRHVYKRVALGLDFADWMIVIRIRKQPKNSVKIEKFSSKCWKKFRIVLVLLYFALCFIQKTRATLSTNQIQNWNWSRLGRPRFPALQAVCLFLHRVVIDSSRYFPSCDWL